ncbi:alpha/beta fold hydrolase [Acidobacteriota bacterium]
MNIKNPNNLRFFWVILFVCFVLLCHMGMATLKESTMKFSPDTQTGFIEVVGGKLFYEIAGKGETIVMIHDGILHRVTWDAQFEVLAKEYKVVRYDRRGYGDSNKAEVKYSDIEDLEKVFKQLNIHKAIVIGMSYGGSLAIDFALANPDKVTKIVLVGSIVSGYGYSEHMSNRGGHLTEAIWASPEALRRYFFEKDPYTVWEGNKKVREKGLRMIEKYPHNLDMEKYKLLQRPERPALGRLDEIKVPALIVVGEYDIPDVHAHAGVIEAGISDAKRVIVNNAGHHVPTEQPEILNELILKFIREK